MVSNKKGKNMEKYTLNLNENNYVLSISHTKNDNVELDLEQVEIEYLNAYKLIDGVLELDEDKKAELIKEEEQIVKETEILELEQDLNKTDYIMARMLEEIMALNNPLTFISDMIKIFVAYGTKYKDTLADRKTWRERIEELRNDK